MFVVVSEAADQRSRQLPINDGAFYQAGANGHNFRRHARKAGMDLHPCFFELSPPSVTLVAFSFFTISWAGPGGVRHINVSIFIEKIPNKISFGIKNVSYLTKIGVARLASTGVTIEVLARRPPPS